MSTGLINLSLVAVLPRMEKITGVSVAYLRRYGLLVVEKFSGVFLYRDPWQFSDYRHQLVGSCSVLFGDA